MSAPFLVSSPLCLDGCTAHGAAVPLLTFCLDLSSRRNCIRGGKKVPLCWIVTGTSALFDNTTRRRQRRKSVALELNKYLSHWKALALFSKYVQTAGSWGQKGAKLSCLGLVLLEERWWSCVLLVPPVLHGVSATVPASDTEPESASRPCSGRLFPLLSLDVATFPPLPGEYQQQGCSLSYPRCFFYIKRLIDKSVVQFDREETPV